MRSLLLEFRADGSAALLPEEAGGFHATVQNALVNLLTEAGSDKVFAERGTNLLRSVAGGAVYNYASACHAANFAAADTLFFSRESDKALQQDRLDDLKLVPDISAGLSYEVSFVAPDGRVLGRPVTNLAPL